MKVLFALFLLVMSSATFAQMPPIEPGVSLELARWRAAHYSDVRYKLSLTLEKMSPVLKGTMEIQVKVGAGTLLSPTPQGGVTTPIILDWRKIKGHEDKSTISNVSVNGRRTDTSLDGESRDGVSAVGDKSVPAPYEEHNEHLIFRDGVVAGENVIRLDFTSPILPSGSAITRYIDKEDGSEYIYSLFVPSDASTAFPVFDQPDLKARFELEVEYSNDWLVVANSSDRKPVCEPPCFDKKVIDLLPAKRTWKGLAETKPISTYVFAFAAGPWERVTDTGGNPSGSEGVSSPASKNTLPTGRVSASDVSSSIYVRKSQAAKFKPHAAEVFRLNREAIKYFEEYFVYKFPFPKYDLVLIPEFPFGGMEHAGATFLRESSIIFPQEPTKNDHISRALLMFHEASHQWFGDTVTMRWFDDLWLKEGFATFTAYKAMERIMPEMMAWKVFYERVKQAAYQTDSTKGTTPIYQEIPNLSAAKSAYGAIVYSKAPAFLRQAEFYLGEDKFQTAVRAFLKKHEFGNAGWEDLVEEFEIAAFAARIQGWTHFQKMSKSEQKKFEEQFKTPIRTFADGWVKNRGLPVVRTELFRTRDGVAKSLIFRQENILGEAPAWEMNFKFVEGRDENQKFESIGGISREKCSVGLTTRNHTSFDSNNYIFPNYQDFGYGIFLLDDKSRDYVLKNIQNEKDPFLRSMMWGALWDSVREGELDPKQFVELVVKNLSTTPSAEAAATPPQTGGELKSGTTPSAAAAATPPQTRRGDKSGPPEGGTQNEDESTTALLLNRVGTTMNYYMSEPPASVGGQDSAARSTAGRSDTSPPANAGGSDLRTRVEDLLIERMRTAETLGQRITFYRAFLNVASSEKARLTLKQMLTADTPRRGADTGGNLSGSEGVSQQPSKNILPTGRVSASVPKIPLKTKDKFDIVTRLLILGDREAPKLLAELEKTETSDDAKRYAYAAKAGIATAENKAKYWNDFVSNKEISESWIEAAFGPWNSIRHSDQTLPYLQKALQELPNHKRNRKIFFVNGWLGAFIGGQRSEEALGIINKFLADNPTLDRDLRLKILENADLIERAVKIRSKYARK